MLEKDGEDHLGRSCEKKPRSITKSRGGKKILRTITKWKANWIGHILRRNCFLKHAIKVKKNDRTERKTRKNT